MPKRSAQPQAPEKAIRKAIARILAQKSRGPRFVVELTSSVHAATRTSSDEVEYVLQALTAEGAVIVRAQSHDDPHLDGLDLRIVAPIDASAEDGLAIAEAQVESLWAHWLLQWQAKHQCAAALD